MNYQLTIAIFLDSIKNGDESLYEEKDEDSLSSILSYINDKSEDHQEKYYDKLPSSSSSSSAILQVWLVDDNI